MLSAPSSGEVGGNGIYAYGASLQFPNQTYQAANYWVDLVFAPPGGAPGAPSTPDLVAASDTGISSTDNLTKLTTPTLVGTAIAGSTVRLFDGTTLAGSATADAGGNWSITTPVLADGSHVFTATDTTANGTSAASGALTVKIDTAAPSAPTTPDMTAASDDGASNTDNATSVTMPTFVGTVANEPTAIVSLYSDAVQVGSAPVDGAGAWAITSTALSVGNHAITARATDAAGNVGALSGALPVSIVTPGAAQTITGTSGIDTLNGGAGDDSISGLAGADQLFGNAGNDTLDGGGGNDTLDGGPGDDLLLIRAAEGQFDTLIGGDGTDTLRVNPSGGAVTLNSTASISTIEVFDGGGQTVRGTSGANLLDFSGFTSVVGVASITGLAGNDSLTGSSGADLLDGGSGNDRLDGRSGDDILRIRAAEGQFDTLIGGGGTDTLRVDASGGALTLNGTGTISTIEVFDGGGQAVRGTSGANLLDFSGFTSVVGVASIAGLGGNDSLTGSSGADILDGGGGGDQLKGGAGGDVLIGGASADSLTGGAEADTFRYLAFSESTSSARDVILDFEGAGVAGGDVIDVSALSAGAFVFKGTGGFSGGGVASIRYVISGGVTDLQFDSGDGGAAEMVVRINAATTFSAGDFIL
jgi:Ca2+-binding RTX toxin-like protein